LLAYTADPPVDAVEPDVVDLAGRHPGPGLGQAPGGCLRRSAPLSQEHPEALSPGVNHPATAVDAIDATDGLLRALAARDLAVTDLTDSAGAVRVRLVLPAWEHYLRTAVEDLLPAVTPSAMVLERLQRLLANLLEISPPPAHAPLLQLSNEVEERLTTCRRPIESGGLIPSRRRTEKPSG
jgi:hypothetical protein